MTLLIEISERIATVTLNRPEALNSLDPETLVELNEAFPRLDQNDDVRVVILTGSGDKAFCTGSDLKKTMPPAESVAQLTFGRKLPYYPFAGLDIEKPIVCAVNGYALAGGMELALLSDVRVAASNAEFGQSEVRVGSIPAAGGTQRLPRLIGRSDAMLMMLTGDRIDAAAALRLGLVSAVVEPEALQAHARAIARRMAENAPLSVRAIKRLVRDGMDEDLEAAIRREQYVLGVLRDTQDRIEGRRAFQERRPPVYQGR
ncbi:enoyl-CoA hydratase/isomerase family protein [Caenimonas aquaedulcis]|uniref:Enoyl-CoA hydratase/isomerase family protein n=1 Tax=Caenimonas aquaedulcis TaxID=2793270 RepID=A0A931H8D2_9BURK|nr:enoyl-CoA hydratase/isomerase family protein [Caenimonas aquaedulcis]MBG9390599.1 enoyl-CoA hydratase/isomerase family protein [Caenimonas aquaedulcis]